MAVEKEGTISAEKENLEKRTEEIVEILKRHKVVVIEDLAAEFEIKSKIVEFYAFFNLHISHICGNVFPFTIK